MRHHPDWIRSKLPSGSNSVFIDKNLQEKALHTVCEEARCPNRGECWAQKTATIMIMGDTCTRACRFCNVKTGNPKGVLDSNEPLHTAQMVAKMDLSYVVITSVDRDDLPDQGASHFAQTVMAIKEQNPKTYVEVLVPDFRATPSLMDILIAAHPFVVAQNLETVKSLTPTVRDRRASYETTLKALAYYKSKGLLTKSSLMVGLGETQEELYEAMKDLREVGVDILTLGQYLRPSKRHLEVKRYYHPDEFGELSKKAYELGFRFVASGPLVRSSYKAADFLKFLERSL